MAAIMQQLQAWVSASGILADKMAVIMIIALFGLMVVGLVLGQELAFVLGGAGVIIDWLAWGGPGVTIAMTKIYDQMQSYSMVAIPMFVLMANFLTHSKVADGLFESIRYLLGPLKGGLGLAVIRSFRHYRRRFSGYSDPALHHAGVYGQLCGGFCRQDLLCRHYPRSDAFPVLHHLPDGGLPHSSRLGSGHER